MKKQRDQNMNHIEPLLRAKKWDAARRELSKLHTPEAERLLAALNERHPQKRRGLRRLAVPLMVCCCGCTLALALITTNPEIAASVRATGTARSSTRDAVYRAGLTDTAAAALITPTITSTAMATATVLIASDTPTITATATPSPTIFDTVVFSTLPPAVIPVSTRPAATIAPCNNADDLNCSDFANGGADAHMQLCGDEDRLDRDGDGDACEDGWN